MYNAPFQPRQLAAGAPSLPTRLDEVSAYHLKLARAVCRRPATHLIIAWLLDWGGPETIAELLEHTWRSHQATSEADEATRASQYFDYEMSRAALYGIGGELAVIQDHLPRR